MSAPRVFDQQHYDLLNRARGDALARLLTELTQPLSLKSSIDIACGAGYFSNFLRDRGFDVTGVDGRRENVDDCQKRYPAIQFREFNAEDTGIRGFGQFDLVLCLGLLYHLENPLLAIRNLHALTAKLVVVEGVIFPGSEPIMGLVDEYVADDQALSYVAFYPTDACLQKMLYRAGFPFVYSFSPMPDHTEYHDSRGLPRVRTMLAASRTSLSATCLQLVSEPKIYFAPWVPASVASARDSMSKLKRFAKKPLKEKIGSIKRLIDKS